MNAPVPYRAAYPEGTSVRIAHRAFLEEFMATWKYHHAGSACRNTAIESYFSSIQLRHN